MKVELLCAGCFHLLQGLFHFVWGATSDVDASAMQGKLECYSVTDA